MSSRRRGACAALILYADGVHLRSVPREWTWRMKTGSKNQPTSLEAFDSVKHRKSPWPRWRRPLSSLMFWGLFRQHGLDRNGCS